ncbi:MAG: methionyl-tRNA formyltransferase [Candidatus Omnitrophica bacterium]|nr:methionyl-tRNA formyltransferase [Candidatus Omnitrophota bacterium]
MDIVFFGSSEFAVKPLQAILESRHKVALVVTQPDRAKGRGLKVSATPVKELAVSKGIEVYQPAALDKKCLRALKERQADLFVVVSYGKIIPKPILDIPKTFSINLHASLLPKYRGAAPINRAIISGEKKTGVSIIRMNEKMDAGDILLKDETAISPDDNAVTLAGKLSSLGSRRLIEAIESIDKGGFSLIKQNEKEATFAPKLKKEDGLIDWSCGALQIHDLVRGLAGWPCAFTYYIGKNLKILKAALSENDFKGAGPAEVVSVGKSGITVKAGSGAVIIQELQLEGARSMSAREFIAGHKMSPGEVLGGRNLLQ